MNTKTHSSFYRNMGTSLLAVGAVVMTIGSQMQLSSNLSSQGSTLEFHDQLVLPAAIESSNPGGVLAFGMLMMLVGFGLHALLVLRNSDERPVPVRKKSSRTSRKQMEVIWVERTIRL